MKLSSVFGLLSTLLLLGGAIAAILPVVSVAELRVSAGSVSLSGCCTASVPITVRNAGFLPLYRFFVYMHVFDEVGAELASGGSEQVSVLPGATVTVNVTLHVSSAATLSSAQRIQVQVSANIGGLLPVSSDTLLSFGEFGSTSTYYWAGPLRAVTWPAYAWIGHTGSDTANVFPILSCLLTSLRSVGGSEL